jgi:uncharacterized membrane protein
METQISIKKVDSLKLELETGQYFQNRIMSIIRRLIVFFLVLTLVFFALDLQTLNRPILFSSIIFVVILFILGAKMEGLDSDDDKLIKKGKSLRRQRRYLGWLLEKTDWEMEWVFIWRLNKIKNSYSTTVSNDGRFKFLQLAEEFDRKLLKFILSHYRLYSPTPDYEPPVSRFFYKKVVSIAQEAASRQDHEYFKSEVTKAFQDIINKYTLKRGEINHLIKDRK